MKKQEEQSSSDFYKQFSEITLGINRIRYVKAKIQQNCKCDKSKQHAQPYYSLLTKKNSDRTFKPFKNSELSAMSKFGIQKANMRIELQDRKQQKKGVQFDIPNKGNSTAQQFDKSVNAQWNTSFTQANSSKFSKRLKTNAKSDSLASERFDSSYFRHNYMESSNSGFFLNLDLKKENYRKIKLHKTKIQVRVCIAQSQRNQNKENQLKIAKQKYEKVKRQRQLAKKKVQLFHIEKQQDLKAKNLQKKNSRKYRQLLDQVDRSKKLNMEEQERIQYLQKQILLKEKLRQMIVKDSKQHCAESQAAELKFEDYQQSQIERPQWELKHQ